MMKSVKSSPRLPPLRALQAFEAVARCGSVADAATELGVSPGAISQQLRKIESSLDLRLLERSGTGLNLTSWGRLYYADLAPGFDQLRSAQTKLQRARSETGLVLSCLPSVANRWIGPRLFDWQAAHPHAKVKLVGTEAEPFLSAGEADFRITYGEAVAGFEHHVELFTDWVVPACAPALLARYSLHHPSDIVALPRIAIEWAAEHGAPPGWSEWAVSTGMDPQWPAATLSFSLSSAAIDAAVNGRGIVLAQISLIGDDLAAGRLVIPLDLRLRLQHPYFLAWDRASLQKPHGAAFRDWLISISKHQYTALTTALPVGP